MEKITTPDGFVIEFEKLSKNEDPETVVEGSVVGYIGWEKNLTVPEEFEYKNGETVLKGVVTSIGISAFENYIYLEKINIPENIVSIGKFAFKKCTSLEYISVSGNVKDIEDYCFIDCTGLKKFELGEGVKTIGDYAFSGCINLSDAGIPQSCYKIGFSAFEKCKSLKNIELPKGIKVDFFAFKDSGYERMFKKETAF